MIPIEFKPSSKELAKILHYYNLLESSDQYKIVCPFHNDINASMLINLNEGSYYCFGCNKNGNAYDFVKDANPKLDDLNKVRLYYKILKSKKVKGIKYDGSINIKKKKTQSPEHVLDVASDYYYNLKTIDWSIETDPIKQYMVDRGFEVNTLNKCKAKLTYNNSYPIVFPMLDMGEFKGWVCRTSNPIIQQKRKYLYNKGFSRSNTLVGKYNNETVVLVEGYMDYLKMKQNGVTYVAAILGWKITTPQINKLKAMGVKNIISALDTDPCGQKGTEYLKKFFNVIRFQFPEGVKDPGDLNKELFKIANKETKKLFRRTKEDEKKVHKKPAKKTSR